MSGMVEVEGLVKDFRGVTAVAGVSFTIHRGEVFGLLGPNGAGKTTTIRLLLGLLKPTAGQVRVAGIDVHQAGDAVRRRMGWVPQSSTLDPLLTGREQLLVFAELYAVPDPNRRVEEALQRFGLAEAAHRLIRHYSGGMRKRLELAAGMLHGPDLLILDEPTAGLDVESRHQLWQVIRELNAAGTTVLLTTHYLDEADRLCHRVAIIDRGRLRALDAPGALKRRYGQSRLHLTWSDSEQLEKTAEVCADVLGVQPVRLGNRLELAVDDLPEALGRLLPVLRERALTPEAVESLSPSLDQVFARITGRSLDPVTGRSVALEAEADAQDGQGPELSAFNSAPTSQPDQDGGMQSPPAGAPARRWDAGTFLRCNLAFLRRWWWRLRRSPLELVTAVSQPALWFLLFGHLWDGAVRPGWAEGGYPRFMTAGAAMMAVFNVAIMGGLDLLVDRERGVLERFLASPAPPLTLVTSRFVFVTALSACQTLAILLAAAAVGVPFALGALTLPGVLLFAALFGAVVTTASLILAFAVEHHGQFYTITGMVSLPAVLVSSAFAPLDRMPGWLAALARVNPMTYAVEGARALIVGGSGPGVAATVAALLVFNAVALLAARRAVRRALA